jgi:hypothetical protein
VGQRLLAKLIAGSPFFLHPQQQMLYDSNLIVSVSLQFLKALVFSFLTDLATAGSMLSQVLRLFFILQFTTSKPH